MSVQYRGPLPDRNYTTKDFLDKGIVITQFLKSVTHENKHWMRVVFRSNGLLGSIRRDCYDKSWCIDVRTEWSQGDRCITTECKSLREAKSILYEWFKSHGFVRNVPSHHYLSIGGRQLQFSPLIFRH